MKIKPFPKGFCHCEQSKKEIKDLITDYCEMMNIEDVDAVYERFMDKYCESNNKVD